MPSDYIQHLIDTCGAKPLPKEETEAYYKEVEEKVIPSIVQAERRQQALAYNVRLQPIRVPKGRD